MNIILETDITEQIASKYILLELDSFLMEPESDPIKSYCVITNENMVLQEIATIESNKKLHENLIKNYRSKNWVFCEEALAHLIGKWKGECDSFYKVINDRIKNFKEQPVTDSWIPEINKF